MFKAMMARLALSAQFASIRARISNFRLNTRGNVAIIFGLAALPMIIAIGCVIDYTTETMIRTKLQAAADAASLATVSINSSVVATAKSMTGDGPVTGGSTYLTNFFNANLTTSPENTGYGTLSLTPVPTVSKTGTTMTATISFTAQVPTYFMGIMGHSNVTVTGYSTSSYTLPTYINFYLMLDVSGSMSFPSTPSEQQRLMAVNPDNLRGSNGYPGGCQFACHFATQGTCAQTPTNNPYQGPIPAAGAATNPGSGGYCQGFIISRLGTTPTSFANGTNSTNGNNVNWNNMPVPTCSTAGTTSCIQLRADAVGYAVTALLAQASSTENNDNVPNEFQVGLFPFIQNLCTANPNMSNSCSVGLTTSLTGGTITSFAQQLANLLDTGQNATLGSGGTHFENVLPSMNSFIKSPIGTGTSSSNALPYVFIVTDGSQDYQTQWTGNWNSDNWSSSSNVPYQNSSTVIPRNPAPPNNRNDQIGGPNATDYCAAMKTRGITVAVLYIPYGTILNPNSNFASNEDGYANNNIQYIPASLQSCASPNFFYTASTPAAIQSALVTMFNQAVSTAAHVTN